MCVTIQLWCLHRALLRAQQVENCATRRWDLCHQHMETSSPLPWYYLKYSFSCFKFRWSGGGRVLRWKWAEKLLDVTVRFLLLNVCLLLGCWQSFYSHSKLFMLISHMDTLKNSWAKRSENPDFSSMWGLCPSVGICRSDDSNNSPLVETRSGQLFWRSLPVSQKEGSFHWDAPSKSFGRKTISECSSARECNITGTTEQQ